MRHLFKYLRSAPCVRNRTGYVDKFCMLTLTKPNIILCNLCGRELTVKPPLNQSNPSQIDQATKLDTFNLRDVIK